MFNLVTGRKMERPLARLRDEFDTLFNRFISRWPAPADTEYGIERFWGLEAEDRDNEIVIRADVPGFEPDELDVQYQGGMLIIKAEKKQESKPGNGHTEERPARSFQRRVMVPSGIKTDEIQAKYHNGVLEVHLPKREEAKPKHIAVQA